MGCILPEMHYGFQHCWELLHPFAYHRQHELNNSNIVGPTMLNTFKRINHLAALVSYAFRVTSAHFIREFYNITKSTCVYVYTLVKAN